MIITPIQYENDNLGLLVLESRDEKQALGGDEPSLLLGIASQIAVSVAGITSFQYLEESERRFRRVFDNAASGIALLDLDGTFMRSNRYLTGMLGYAEDNLAQMRLQG